MCGASQGISGRLTRGWATYLDGKASIPNFCFQGSRVVDYIYLPGWMVWGGTQRDYIPNFISAWT